MEAPPGAGALLDGRYQLGPMIARGGMSTVHRGTDTRLDRPVAIKVMDPRLAGDPAFRRRFEREARSAARIDHPAVVDVHDQGAHVGQGPEPVLFLVMELVEGGTLRDVLRARGALGVPAAFAVLEPVLAGLAQAHRLGLVHRDVKPENVLISRAGAVKVADFGLVTAAAQAGASHVGMIMGTVAYLSPEQVTTGAADSRSDVYAAGILLYELLTGAPPYTGDTSISVAYRHVTSEVPAPSLIAGDVPPELDALVLRATNRDPGARYADADALLDALRELRSQLAIPRVLAPIPPLQAITDQDTVPAHARNGAAGPRGTAVYEAPGGRPGHGAPGGTRTMARPGATGVLPPADHRAAGDGAGHRFSRRRRMFAAWTTVIVVLGLLVAVTSYWLGTGRWTVMPSVVGLDRTAAEQILTEAGLVAVITPTFSDDIAAGIVAGADQAPEVELLRGSEVTLTVSSGRPVVPRIAPGTAVDVAEQQLRDAGLTPVQDTGDGDSDNRGRGDGDGDNRGRGGGGDDDKDRNQGRGGFDEDLPTGSVLRTDPEGGTVLAVGAPVALVLNVEEEQITVPFLIGRNAEDARKELEDRDLRADVRSQLPFLRGDGNVISQSPGPGTRVEPGTTVLLTTL